MPDVSTFPRAAWLRALREALATLPDADLQYGDPLGVEVLRAALSDYLGRVRGVVADPARVVVTTGYTQSLALICHALAADGATRIALEDPTNPEQQQIARRAGLEPVPIAVDADGLRIDALERARADAVVVTPAHQHPTGAVLSGERRTALLALAAGPRRRRDRGRLRRRVPLRPRRRRRAPGSRARSRRLRRLAQQDARAGAAARLARGPSAAARAGPRREADRRPAAPPGSSSTRSPTSSNAGSSTATSAACAPTTARGGMRWWSALAEALPEAVVRGVAAGLHVTVELSAADDERAIAEEAARRRIALATHARLPRRRAAGPAMLMLGYGQAAEPTIRAGVRALAEAVRAARG